MGVLTLDLEGEPTSTAVLCPTDPMMGSEVGNSEYESADEEELVEEEEDEEEIEGNGVQQGDNVDDENKKLDDDEDRKNPQYIPKKGTFYEHDDRTAADDVIQISKTETPVETPTPTVKKESKKKVWKEDDRWHHDKFNELDQSPKSRDELVEIYGYDIRNEEGPPRARRRRRYGRGPNKYTRNWEDLDAYSKPTRGGGVSRGGKGGKTRSTQNLNEEEFPALSSINNGENEPNHMQNDMKNTYSEINLKFNQEPSKILNSEKENKQLTGSIPPAPTSHKYAENRIDNNRSHEYSRGGGASHPKPQRGGNRGGKNKDFNRSSYHEDQWMNEKNYNRGRGHQNDNYSGRGRGRGAANHYGSHGGGNQHYNNHNHKDIEDLSIDIKSITISNSHLKEEPQFRGKNRTGNEGKKSNVPPRMQDMGTMGNRSNNISDSNNVSRPKRYSSQRQRPVPEQSISPFQHQGYQNNLYDENETSTTSAIGAVPNPMPHGGSPSFVPPAFTSPATYPPEPFLGSPSTPRMFPPVTQTPPLIMAPPVGGTPVTVPPAVGVPSVVAGAGPPVTGPPFLPPENMINYVGPPAAPAQFPGAHPPQFPPFQPYTATQPQEIYSNGVTYYNTQSQQVVPRTNIPLQKRPKAAIPIVPPPDKSQNGLKEANNTTTEDESPNTHTNEVHNLEESTESTTKSISECTSKIEESDAGKNTEISNSNVESNQSESSKVSTVDVS